ncbi:MAG: hypothetical protein M0D53_15255 [Flavobacterium sp. JAD_PAG50586_2]|nr:MAG: hypothetical protein M0D53_15255 [Flavobacterium sp. JAD_PAG50586_2]
MTEKQNFLRIVKAMYENIMPANYSGELTKIEKLKELQRFLNEFEIQTNNIERMLNTYIQLGILPLEEKEEIIESIKKINGDYLDSLRLE